MWLAWARCGGTKRNPLQSVEASLRNFDDFEGTADRCEFGWFLAMMVLVTLAIATVIHPKAYQIVAIILLFAICAVGSRRCVTPDKVLGGN